MKTITTDLYSFTELTQEAKDVAIQNFLSTDREYYWNDEWLDSLKALAEYWDGELRDWQVGAYCHSYASIGSIGNASILDLSGVRAWTWILNNTGLVTEDFCPTGYCGDFAAFAPLVAFCTRPANPSLTIGQLIQQCCDSLVEDWVADMRHQDSEEFAEDELLGRSDEELFTIDGSTF
jgi:hypothetical protein